MALLDLFITSSIPVLKVLLVIGLGAYLSLDSVNILNEDARKHLNNISFYVFNPALVSSNLAETITYESMVEMWFMPFNILITFIAGSVLGWIVIQITRPPVHLRGLVISFCAAGNLGHLCLIIIPAVCKERGSPFGNPNVCHKFAMGYASLSMALVLSSLYFGAIAVIGAIYLWSYVYNIIRIYAKRRPKEVEINDPAIKGSSRDSSCSPSGAAWTEPLLSSDHVIGGEDHENVLSLPQYKLEDKPQVSVSDKIKQKLEMLLENIDIKRLFAPSTIGAIAGFVVGLVPLSRNLMIGDAAPLRVIQDTVVLLGFLGAFVATVITIIHEVGLPVYKCRDGAIPAVTLIMGGNLLKGLRGSEIRKSLIFGIIIVRYIALPLIGIAVVKGALRLGLVHHNPLYQFVLLLQFALPPATNIATMTQLFKAGETECSVIMLWCYLLASVVLTSWSAFFMWLVS